MENLEIERLSKYLQNKHKIYYSVQTSMGIILTDKCPAGCRHCISDNSLSPDNPIPEKVLLERVDKTSELKLFEKVIITGGEPFYESKKLLELVKHISECKLKPSVVTGAWWASSPEKSRRVLADLKKAGLYSIALSADRYHQEKIPITNLANALNACIELELQYTLVLTGTADRDKDKQYEDKLKKVISGPADSKLRISRGSMLNSGRALKNQLINERYEEDQFDPVICQSMGKIIRSDGLIAQCCGANLPVDSPLLAGNIDELPISVIKKKLRKNFLIPFLEIYGLRKMTEMLEEKFHKRIVDKKELRTDNRCNVCRELFAIKEHVDFFNKKLGDQSIQNEMKAKYLLLYGHRFEPLIQDSD